MSKNEKKIVGNSMEKSIKDMGSIKDMENKGEKNSTEQKDKIRKHILAGKAE